MPSLAERRHTAFAQALALSLVVVAASCVVAAPALSQATTKRPQAGKQLRSLVVQPAPEAALPASADAIFRRPFRIEAPVGFIFDHTNGLEHDGEEVGYWGGGMPGTAGPYHRGHRGYDISMPTGTPLFAVADGNVIFAGPTPMNCPQLGGVVQGNVVTIEHTTPTGLVVRSQYAHLDRVDVRVGQHVVAGEPIGRSGASGCALGPHLHFGATRVTGTRDGNPVDIDPYGWQGAAPDPYATANGAGSVWLWRPGEAPEIVGEATFEPVRDLAVQITRWRFWAPFDDRDLNLDWFDLTLMPDARGVSGGSYDLSQILLILENGETIRFPRGLSLTRSQPVLRVHLGSGANSATDYHLGRRERLGSFERACLRINYPDGLFFRYAHQDGGYAYLLSGDARETRVCP